MAAGKVIGLVLLKTLITAIGGPLERTWHVVANRRARRRLDALYGPRPFEAGCALLGPAGQAAAVEATASRYRGRTETTLDAHARASVKLDAAEYAFSRMLDDLATVMDRPSRWSPERVAYSGDSMPVLPRAVAA